MIEKLSLSHTFLFYHNDCKLKYIKNCEQIISNVDCEDKNYRVNYSKAFDSISGILKKSVLIDEEYVYLNCIYDKYIYFIKLYSENDFVVPSYINKYYLQKRIMDEFGSKVTVTKISRKTTVLHKSGTALPNCDILYHQKMQTDNYIEMFK